LRLKRTSSFELIGLLTNSVCPSIGEEISIDYSTIEEDDVCVGPEESPNVTNTNPDIIKEVI